jgi:hypothetical protein
VATALRIVSPSTSAFFLRVRHSVSCLVPAPFARPLNAPSRPSSTAIQERDLACNYEM